MGFSGADAPAVTDVARKPMTDLEMIRILAPTQSPQPGTIEPLKSTAPAEIAKFGRGILADQPFSNDDHTEVCVSSACSTVSSLF